MVKKTRKSYKKNKNISKKHYLKGGGDQDATNAYKSFTNSGVDLKSVAAMGLTSAAASNPAMYKAYQAAEFASKFLPPLTIDMPPDNDYPQVEELREIILGELLQHPNFAPLETSQIAENDIEKLIVNTKFRKIIEDKLICDHTHKLLVQKFVEFIEKKALTPHYHSKSEKDNLINGMDMFYRHGLSKIISKIFEDITKDKDPTSLDFFLQELEKRVLKMDNSEFIQFLMGENLLFEIMDDTRVNELINNTDVDVDQIGALLIDLYDETEFNELLEETDKAKWQEIYKKYLDIKKKEDAEKQQELLEQIKNGSFTPPETNTNTNTIIITQNQNPLNK